MSLAFAVPPFTFWHDALWDTILDLSALLDDGTWVLVGGQAVVAQEIVHDRGHPRSSRNPDPTGGIVTVASALPTVQRSLGYLGFEPDGPQPPAARTYRYRRDPDRAGADQLPQVWTVHVVGVTALHGGDQALARRVRYQVSKGMRSPIVPIPDLLSTLIFEASQFAMETVDPLIHARDVAYLVSLIDDPIHERGRLTPVDGRALRALDLAVGTRDHQVWQGLPPQREAFTRWRSLLES